MGLKYFKLVGARLGFLGSGCTTAWLRQAKTQPEDRELFTVDKIVGPALLKTSLRNLGGIRSEGHDEGFIHTQ